MLIFEGLMWLEHLVKIIYILFLTDCPYGGICDQDVKVKANFWGEEHNNDIYMHICPSGYCCPEASCDSLQTCAPHR